MGLLTSQLVVVARGQYPPPPWIPISSTTALSMLIAGPHEPLALLPTDIIPDLLIWYRRYWRGIDVCGLIGFFGQWVCAVGRRWRSEDLGRAGIDVG